MSPLGQQRNCQALWRGTSIRVMTIGAGADQSAKFDRDGFWRRSPVFPRLAFSKRIASRILIRHALQIGQILYDNIRKPEITQE